MKWVHKIKEDEYKDLPTNLVIKLGDERIIKIKVARGSDLHGHLACAPQLENLRQIALLLYTILTIVCGMGNDSLRHLQTLSMRYTGRSQDALFTV